MYKNKMANGLTKEELEQLKCWLSATPLQRLEWLEEAQRIAEKSGALERYRLISENDFQSTALSS
jgi:hypothetical protein